MAKRNATTELNHDNWDREDDNEPEEPGIFQAASEDTLKQRTIKKAKRRVQTEDGTNNTFSGFAGFGTKSTTGSNSTANFSFLSNIANSTSKSPLKNNNTTSASNFSFLSNISKPTNDTTKPSTESDKSAVKAKDDEEQNPRYLAQLKNLNEGVLAWIKSHVEKNPYCILTPIFKDYEKHLSELDSKCSSGLVTNKENSSEKTAVKSEGGLTAETPRVISAPLTSAGGTSTFSFGLAAAAKPSMANGDQTSGLFSFGTSSSVQGTPASIKPFSFAVASTQPAQTSDRDANEEEAYEPPKNDYVPVTEEDSLYSTKCKLFYLNAGAYVDKGVGTLYLKKCEDKAPQLLVRADTNLGNILLNISLSASLPMQRTGKNYVQVVCVPFPPLDPKKETQDAVTFLVRVKNGEAADSLLSELNKHKK